MGGNRDLYDLCTVGGVIVLDDLAWRQKRWGRQPLATNTGRSCVHVPIRVFLLGVTGPLGLFSAILG